MIKQERPIAIKFVYGQVVLDIFFTLISLFYAFRGVQIAVIVVREWAIIRGQTFTPHLKSLASQASFFLAVPIGVFVHELGHAIFVILFGGEVLEFGYRVFWGFVRPGGTFTADQNWLIALAGTLGSLLFGVAIWLIFKNHSSPTFRYFGLRAFRFQIFFSLVYYPVFTLLGFYGDWRTIYDFNATPILSGATAVLHAATLFLFWQADRNGFFEMGAFGSPEMKARVMALEKAVASNPYDEQLKLDLINTYIAGGMLSKAKQLAQQMVKENPNSAEGYLRLAMAEGSRQQEIPPKANKNAEKAIALGLTQPASIATAYQIVGRYSLGVNKLDEAIAQLSQAIETSRSLDDPNQVVFLLYHRSLAYRRKEQYETAYQDLQRAMQLAREAKLPEAISFLEKEMAAVSKHAGRPFDQFNLPSG